MVSPVFVLIKFAMSPNILAFWNLLFGYCIEKDETHSECEDQNYQGTAKNLLLLSLSAT
jgi:hypothetical protein